MIETPAYASARPQARRTADDWARLADLLGIERPPEPEPPAPVASEAPAVSEVAKPAPLAEAWTESVIELMVNSPEAPAPTPPAETEFRGDRPRRKRDRRGHRPPEDEAAEAPSPHAPRSEFGAGLDIEPVELAEEPAADVAPPATVAGEEPRSPERSKRRRRRRGEKRRDRESDRQRAPEAESPAASKPQRTAKPPEVKEAPDALESDDDLLDDDQEEDVEDVKEGKEGHRAIPNWQEAISYIIDRNMESRARRPDSGPSRSRGHSHGRGRE